MQLQQLTSAATVCFVGNVALPRVTLFFNKNKTFFIERICKMLIFSAFHLFSLQDSLLATQTTQ